MKIEQAIKIIENHNKWRRDKNVPSKYISTNPKDLGLAIDSIVKHYKNCKLKNN